MPPGGHAFLAITLTDEITSRVNLHPQWVVYPGIILPAYLLPLLRVRHFTDDRSSVFFRGISGRNITFYDGVLSMTIDKYKRTK